MGERRSIWAAVFTDVDDNPPGKEIRGYVVGAKYRVAKRGATLLHYTPNTLGGVTGEFLPLKVGSVVTFLGQRWGSGSDPGVVLMVSAEVKGERRVGEFRPVDYGGDDPVMCRPRFREGYLEPHKPRVRKRSQ